MRYYIALFLILAARAFGAINVENGAADVITYFVLVDQTTGDRDTGVTIANLEMYYVEDQAAESADAFVGAHGAVTDAHTTGECIHVGHGLYRIDWPDAAFDGGVGKRVQLTVVDGDAGAKTETLEVLLSPPSNTTQLDGSDIVQASGVVAANTTQLGGVTQSLTDLKDFADAGYNPATDKVTGVLLTDTTTASTNAETAIGNLKDFDSVNDAVAVVTLVNGLAANVITTASINDGAITDAKIATIGVNVVSEANIDFGALKKTSLNAATPDLSAITGDKNSYKATGFSTHDAAAVKTAIEAGGSTLAQILADTSAYDTDAEYAAAIWNALTNAYGGVGTYGQAIEDGAGGLTAQQVWEDNISAIANTNQSGGVLIWLFNLAEGDEYIDTTQTPWQWVKNKKSTPGTEYLRKDLVDVSGGNITSTSTVIGKQTEP